MPSAPAALRTLALTFLLLAPSAYTCGGSPPQLHLDSPAQGDFLIGASVLVEGRLTRPNSWASLTVNGIAVPVGEDWSVSVPVDPAAVFNRITVEGLQSNGKLLRETALVVVGDGVTTGFVLDGDHSPDSVALRIADTGLGQIAPVVESLSSDALDVSDLITGQNPIAQGSMSGINYTANVVEVGFGGFGLSVVPGAGGLDTTVSIDDFFLEIDLDLGWLGSCTLEVMTSSTDIGGTYSLAPLASDPSSVDVNLVSAVSVNLGGFSSQFVSGICDDPLIGDIIGLILGEGEIQQLMQDGFQDNLADPDGPGPQDSALAAGIQNALAGISIAGPVGDALGGSLDAPIASILQETTGITLLADAAFTATTPDPSAPDLPASYSVAETPPVFGTTTPVGGAPYGMAFAISTSALNQLLKTQIENGLLQEEITEMLGQPLDVQLMSLFVPQVVDVYGPTEPVAIRIRPTLAPVFTGAPGPGGELAEMKIGGLAVDAVVVSLNEVFLTLEVDLDAGVNLAFTPAGLQFALVTPGPADIGIVVVENPLEADEAALITIFQNLFPFFAPELANALEAFPIPAFLGLDLAPLEVARMAGGFLGLFADLTLTPTSQIANVSFTDLSSGDFRQQGGCWLREWRHRVAGAQFGNHVSANLRGMLGADAGCTTNDAQSLATAAYRVAFDIVSVPGEQWTLDIQHALRGALDRISDGYTDCCLFQDGGGSAILHTNMQASVTLDGAPAGSFDITPSVVSIYDGIGGSSSDEDVEFSGASGTQLQGTGDVYVAVTFSMAMEAFSESHTAFPTSNGDEMAIRLGKNDTIDNNFTAGEYPGMGNRNIAGDGHMVDIVLTAAPAP